MPVRPRSRRALLASLVAVGALAACGQGPPKVDVQTDPGGTPLTPLPTIPPSPTPIPTAAATATALAPIATAIPTATPIPVAARPALFTWALEADPFSLDGQLQTSTASLQAYEHIYESLTAFDDKLNVVPSVAAGWEMALDGSTFTFHVDPAARFHDGQEVRAEDLKYSFDRLLAPDTRSPWATSWFEPVRTTVVVDAKTLRFELKRPYPHLPSVLSSLRGGIVLPRGAESKIDLATQAIGTGPFKLKTFAQNERLVYERNTAYRAKDVPKVDGMVARVMPDENDRIVALRSGAIDYAALSPEGLRKLGQSREIQVVGGPRAWLATIDLPYNTHAAFRDARVRRAFSLAIDREEIVKKTLLGAGALSGFVPTGFWDYALTEADLRPRVRRDVDEAKALLADAGFPGGKGFPEVKLVASPDYPEFLSNARLVQAQLRDVGLNLEIQQVDWGSYVALVNKGDVQLGFSASTFYPDPDLYLWPIGHSQSLRGVRGYRHQNQAELDKLLDDARTFLGPREQRRELFHRADRMLLDDPPMLPLYVAASIEAVSSRVKGYTSSFTGRKPAFRNVVLG